MPKALIVQADAFTDRPFAGNPAGVCVLTEPQTDEWMQSVATEMNLSETAFVQRQGDDFLLRWFTPAVEVDLCGHATLATSTALWSLGLLAYDQPARFHTRSGLLIARRLDDWIELDFPAEPATLAPVPAGLLESLGISQPHFVGRNRMDYLVEADSEAEIRSLQPNFIQLAATSARGVIVTARAATAEYDFVSRFFGPAVGIPEDPVTGSAHCCLGPYWQARLGKDQMVGYQASARGGVVRVRMQGKRVLLAGQTRLIFQGTLEV